LGGGFFKIVHEKFRAKGGDADRDNRHGVTTLSDIFYSNPDLKAFPIKDTVFIFN
jgi:hypothetical protein